MYDALAEMEYALSDAEAAAFWHAASSPQRVETLMVRVETLLQVERQKLVQILELNQRRLSEDIRLMAEVAARLFAFDDLDQPEDPAETAKDLQARLSDCTARSEIYAKHAALLSTPLTKDENLITLAHTVGPYVAGIAGCLVGGGSRIGAQLFVRGHEETN